jgi:hypothetical protein
MPERPIQEAANEITQLAAEARYMLGELYRSWLWALLTLPRPQIPNECKDVQDP